MAEALHPHVSALHHLRRLVMLGIGTPLALWLLVSLVLPCALGPQLRDQVLVPHLQRLQRSEQWQAQWATPGWSWAGLSCQSAWPYAWACRQVARVCPLAFQPANPTAADQAARPAPAAGAVSVPATLEAERGKGAHGPLQAAIERACAWSDQMFWPIQRPWWTCILTRAVYAADGLLLTAPMLVMAFFLGEFRARSRQAAGIQPMAHRFHWWMSAVRTIGATIPAVIALPWPLPTVPVLAGLDALTVISVLHARTHFIEL